MNPELILDTTPGWTSQQTQVLNTLLTKMEDGSPSDIKVANTVLQKFEQRTDTWMYCPTVIQDEGSIPSSRFVMLNILQKTIQTRWGILPTEQTSGIRNFIGLKVMEMSVDESCPSYLLQKYNGVLIDLIKKEWPENWPSMMDDLMAEARNDARKCNNILKILSGLADSVFDDDCEGLNMERRKKLQISLTDAFPHVSSLCSFVIELYRANPSSIPHQLVEECLKCLTAFIGHVDVAFVIKNEIPQLLCKEFFDMSVRIVTINFLIEVANIKTPGDKDLAIQFNDMLATVFAHVVNTTQDIPPMYMNAGSSSQVSAGNVYFWEEFFMKIVMFITTTLQRHLDTLSSHKTSASAVDSAMVLLARMTKIEHDETFKVLLFFWQHLLAELYKREKAWNKRSNESKKFAAAGLPQRANESMMWNTALMKSIGGDDRNMRHCAEVNRYQGSLNELRRIFLSRMVKPQEIYITYDPSTGTVEREWEIDTEEVQLYEILKELHVWLVHLGNAESLSVLEESLHSFTSNESRGELANLCWNPASFNRLCWTVGSISGALPKDDELAFSIKIIKKLLWLCENKQGKQNKAIVATMTMHVVGKYSRLLERSRVYLEAVIDKTFEFMRDDFPGIQEMAVETLLKLCRVVKVELARPLKPDEKSNKCAPGQSLLEVMIARALVLESTFKSPRNLILLYEALATVVSGLPEAQKKPALASVLQKPMDQFRLLIKDEQTFLTNIHPASRQLVIVLRTFESVCSAVGVSFHPVFEFLFKDLCFIYRSFSDNIIQRITEGGPRVASHELVKSLRLCNKEILVLIGKFIQSLNPKTDSQLTSQVVSQFLPPLLEFVLQFYRTIPDVAKDHEVLKFCHTLATHLSVALDPALGNLFDCVFAPTLGLISSDQHSYMDHRRHFYELLDACTTHCLEGILQLPTERLRLYVEILEFGARHEQPYIADLSLRTIICFLNEMQKRSEDRTRHNYQQYFTLFVDFCKVLYYDMLGSMLAVTTDTMHKNGFFSQCEVLYLLFRPITTGLVAAPEANLDQMKLGQWLVLNIQAQFPNMTTTVIQGYCERMLSACSGQISKPDDASFAQAVRDFLIDSKVFQTDEDFGKMNSKHQAQIAKAERDEFVQTVPGMAPDKELEVNINDDEL